MNGVFRAPKNEGFTKWPAELRFLKTPAFRFTCGRTKMVFFEHDDVIHYTATHTLCVLKGRYRICIILEFLCGWANTI